uniref:Uncharacterized protein n=1 Tax=Setaria italica TaxID=4555 RepID=K4A4A1_SETIT
MTLIRRQQQNGLQERITEQGYNTLHGERKHTCSY